MTSKIKVDNIENQCGGAVVTKCGATTTIAGTNVNATTVTATNVVGSTAVKSDNIQAADGGNIINQCGTTITLGASGDTINLASGASQSGFGRTGTVDWQTSIKTATFTAASGEGYFCNTSGGAFTVNLPSSPSVGDIVAIKDYGSSFATNNLTIDRGGSNMNGDASDNVRNTDNESLTLVYADATKGWLAVEEGTGYVGESFMTATGGTISDCGNFRTHIFTGPGTFTVSTISGTPANNAMDYLVVAGGAGAGSRQHGSGGGAGGFRVSNSLSLPAPSMSPLSNPTGLTATVTSFPITVGGGGTGGPGSGSSPTNNPGNSGSNSVFSTITSAGGGAGGAYAASGGSGGSGGGGGGNGVGSVGTGGSGNTPPVSPSQGNNGGNGSSSEPCGQGGGGGGAAAVGAVGGNPSGSGLGGAGSFVSTTFIGPSQSSNFGTPGPAAGRYFAGGGAGGVQAGGSPKAAAAGGGGAGTGSSNTGGAGTTNTGGGGGGAGGPGGDNAGGAGGSGIVMIRYRFQ